MKTEERDWCFVRDNLMIMEEEEEKEDVHTTTTNQGGVAGLRNLAVVQLPKLVHLPKWLLQNQSSRLVSPTYGPSLYECPNLMSLSEGTIPLPPTLIQLLIVDRPKLTGRCQILLTNFLLFPS